MTQHSKHIKAFEKIIPKIVITSSDSDEVKEKKGRGRPRKIQPQGENIEKPEPKKRGRKPLSDEERLERVKARLPAVRQTSAEWYAKNKQYHLDTMKRKYWEKVAKNTPGFVDESPEV